MKETIIMQFQTVLNEVIFRQTFFFLNFIEYDVFIEVHNKNRV